MRRFLSHITVWTVLAILALATIQGVTASNNNLPPVLDLTASVQPIYPLNAMIALPITLENRSIIDYKLVWNNSCKFDIYITDGTVVYENPKVCATATQEMILGKTTREFYNESFDLKDSNLKPGNYRLVIEANATATHMETGMVREIPKVSKEIRLYADKALTWIETNKSTYRAGEAIVAGVVIENQTNKPFVFPFPGCEEGNWSITRHGSTTKVFEGTCPTPAPNMTLSVMAGARHAHRITLNANLSAGNYDLHYDGVATKEIRVGSGGTAPVNPTPSSGTGFSGGEPLGNRPFRDIYPTHWAYDYIVDLKEAGVVSGYEGGYFWPESAVTRAEFLKMLMEGLELSVSTSQVGMNPFTDVRAGTWYFPYVKAAKTLGLVEGYVNGTFHPSASINRAEAVHLALNLSDMAPLRTWESPSPFKDVYSGNWFGASVSSAFRLDLIGGYPDGTFRPANDLTRAEAARIVSSIRSRMGE